MTEGKARSCVFEVKVKRKTRPGTRVRVRDSISDPGSEAQERNHEGKTPTQQKKKFSHRSREGNLWPAKEKSLDEEKERAGLATSA